MRMLETNRPLETITNGFPQAQKTKMPPQNSSFWGTKRNVDQKVIVFVLN